MKSGAPAWNSEYMRATQMTGQLARFYGLPMRSSFARPMFLIVNQFGKPQIVCGSVQSGTNLVYHEVG